VVLKNFALASSEVFKRSIEKYSEYFREIQVDIIPGIQKYLNDTAKLDYPILESKHNMDEIKSHLIVVKKELEEIIENKIVEDKFIKFDEQVRK